MITNTLTMYIVLRVGMITNTLTVYIVLRVRIASEKQREV